MVMSKELHDELCVSYASLVLFDGEAEISADSISTVIAASKNSVEPYWPSLFAKILSSESNVLDIISSGGPAGGAVAAGGAAAGGGEEAPVVEEEKVEEEEADIGGGMDMFGGGSDY